MCPLYLFCLHASLSLMYIAARSLYLYVWFCYVSLGLFVLIIYLYSSLFLCIS